MVDFLRLTRVVSYFFDSWDVVVSLLFFPPYPPPLGNKHMRELIYLLLLIHAYHLCRPHDCAPL